MSAVCHADTAAEVRAFYEALPFNFAGSTTEQADAVRARNQIAVYEPLDAVLRADRPSRVLDVGSGAGWFVNSIAHWYGIPARGIDFCENAVTRAWQAAVTLGLSEQVDYVLANIFELPDWLLAERYAVVNSLGVLHHTQDCREACRIAISLVEPGGYFHLGLYHRHGRRPLLDLFEPIRTRAAAAQSADARRDIEHEGFRQWKALHKSPLSETFLLSWYRDQCLHPHETQWTASDVLTWFEESGVEPLSTSLDRFKPNPDWAQIAVTEPQQEDIGRAALAQGRFFPGFFTILGRKR
jgi:SAM-dependent methyltransferase